MSGIALTLVACLLLPGCQATKRTEGFPEGFHKGMVLGLFSDGNGDGYLRNLRELRALGVDSVSLHVVWSLPDVRAVSMAPRRHRTPSDERLRRAVRAAHAEGMRVMIFPLLFVERLEEKEWRGVLDPRDDEAWWEGYEAFILRYARLAAEEEVEILSLGSELCSMEEHAARWRALAEKVRGIYPGELTYTVNWDHLEAILPWADRLDLVGMNAYHEVGREGSSLPELRRAWLPVREDLAAWQALHGKPVIVTEVGYPSRTASTATPWDHTARGEPAPGEQARGYRAFLETWDGVPWLRGSYFYLWWGEGGPGDLGYTPRGKPAAHILARWYADRVE